MMPSDHSTGAHWGGQGRRPRAHRPHTYGLTVHGANHIQGPRLPGGDRPLSPVLQEVPVYRSKAAATLAAVVALMTSACGDTEPAAPTTPVGANPQYIYTNGPNTPNVFRDSFNNIQFGVFDEQLGLIAWAGLATDPTQGVDCGGNQTGEPIAIQFAGLKQALNALAVGREINIHVYDINTSLEDTCFAQPIASGTGHMVYADNDVAVSGPGAEAFGLTLVGTVTTTAGGETLRLQGTVRWVVSPDGAIRLVTSRLSLTPVRRP